MQAEVADDPLDAANANEMVGLLELLSDDLGRSIRIQETMSAFTVAIVKNGYATEMAGVRRDPKMTSVGYTTSCLRFNCWRS